MQSGWGVIGVGNEPHQIDIFLSPWFSIGERGAEGGAGKIGDWVGVGGEEKRVS